MAEGEVQDLLNELRDAAAKLADLDIADVVATLQRAADQLNTALADFKESDAAPAEPSSTDTTATETTTA